MRDKLNGLVKGLLAILFLASLSFGEDIPPDLTRETSPEGQEVLGEMIDREFRAKRYLIDKDPEVIQSDPDGIWIGLTPTIRVTFDEAMDTSNVESNISITGLGNISGGSWSKDKRTYSYRPSADLTPDATYTVTINAGVGDLNSGTMQNNYVWQFTPKSQYDKPNRITDLTLTKSNTDVILSWGALTENVTEYRVYRANNPAMTDNLTLLSTTTGATYTDLGAIGNSYFYAIVPINVTREGPMSNLGYVKVFHFVPPPPHTQGLYWIALPPRHEYNYVSDIVTDWGVTDGNSIIVFGRFNYDTQQYEDYFYFSALGGWAGDNFAVGPCAAFYITIESEVTVSIVGSDDPDYEITVIPNPDISDDLIMGLPYGVIYQHSNDLITALGSEDGTIINTLTEYKNDGQQGQHSYSYSPALGSWDHDLGFDLEIGVPIEVTLSDPGPGILNWKPETYPVQ